MISTVRPGDSLTGAGSIASGELRFTAWRRNALPSETANCTITGAEYYLRL